MEQRIICIEKSSFLGSVYETLLKKFLNKECHIYSSLEQGLLQIPLVKPDFLIIDFDTVEGKIDLLIPLIPTGCKVIITSTSSTELILPYENWIRPISVDKIQKRFFEIFAVSEEYVIF